MSWPRGKYNGRRIEGFRLSLAVHLFWWNWRPRFHWNFGEPVCHWLCVTLRAYPEYELAPRRARSP